MGVATVALVHDLVRRPFGRTGGFVAGLVLALTPVSVAIARHNNPDALLVLCVVAALWCTVRALEDGRTRWLLLAGVAVGLGFEAKMAAALLVVPAIAAAYVWVAPRGRGARRGPAARRRRRDGARRRRLAAAHGAHARGVAAVGVRHERQQHPLAHLRLQRPGPARRAGRRARRDGRRRWRRRVRRRRGRVAAAQREPRRAGRLAARLRGRRRGGRGRRVAAAADGRPHGLDHRHGRRVPHDGRRLQRGPGHLPPLLRVCPRAVRRGARRRGRGAALRPRPRWRGGSRRSRSSRAWRRSSRSPAGCPASSRSSSPSWRWPASLRRRRSRWPPRPASARPLSAPRSPRCCSRRRRGRCRRSATRRAGPSPRAGRRRRASGALAGRVAVGSAAPRAPRTAPAPTGRLPAPPAAAPPAD